MKIAIVTLYTYEIQNYGKLTSYNKESYAEKYSHDCVTYTVTLDSTRHPAWSKIKALQNHNSNYYDWLFWTDADSIITNLNIPLTSFIDNNYDVIWCKDLEPQYPCTGNMLIKCCESNKDWLEEVYKQEQFIDHHWWEQAAIRHLLDVKYPLKHKLLEPRAFNSFVPEFKEEKESRYHKKIGSEYFWEPGDFMCHVLGDRGKKYLRIKKYLNKII